MVCNVLHAQALAVDRIQIKFESTDFAAVADNSVLDWREERLNLDFANA